MKTRITILLAALFVSFNISFAQQDEECVNNLSIFDTAYKRKKFDEAYGPWKIVREKCPKYNRAIYAYGDNILEHKIENSTGAEQIAHIKDLMTLYDQSHEYYPSHYELGEMLDEKAQLAYKYRDELNLSAEQIYDMFDEAYKKDKENFDSAKGLYTYFSLAVDLYDAKKIEAQEMFNKYDDVMEILEGAEKKYIKALNTILDKEEAGTALTSKESKYKSSYESNLQAYDTVKSSMDKKMGDRATCEVLVPLYQKDYEQNKTDKVWLQRAIDRMYAKGCKEDPLFVKLVEQKHALEPNGNTALYLYSITGESKYFDQAIQLEQDPIKKARLYKKLASELKDKGQYSKARQYFMEALKLNPSDGSPHLYIANMYAKSANSCGDTNFNKRAVFWLAAAEARKAGRVDGRLKSTADKTAASFEASAPAKADIFSEGNAGQSIKIGCWIGRSVTVPNI